MKHLTRSYLIILLASLGVPAHPQEPWIQVSGGQWTVEQSALVPLQEKIKTYVEREAKIKRFDLRPWSEYKFQYQERLLKGTRYIYINGFCETMNPESVQSSFVEVFDGGTCYFRLNYDPATGRFSQLNFNGVG